MQYVRFFNQISKKDANMAGGKGASLGEMTQKKISVPPGFVILANAFDHFLADNNITTEIESELGKINFVDPNSVEETSERLRGLIDRVKMPKKIVEEIENSYWLLVIGRKKTANNHLPLTNNQYVAVRSSATAEDSAVASWAGELETYLYTNHTLLIANIKRCWSSLFTPRALFYRHEKGLHEKKVSVAVVVQKMINAEISGITFTVHPVSKELDQMVIEAGWGLGEAIVGGLITPDTYIIEKSKIILRHNSGCPEWNRTGKNQRSKIKKEFVILDINVVEQSQMIVRDKKGGTKTKEVPQENKHRQKLSGEQIIELAKICQKIEELYRSPQDIEWCIEKPKIKNQKPKIYIVQSRPITTL